MANCEAVTAAFAVWEVNGYMESGPVALTRYNMEASPFVRLSQVRRGNHEWFSPNTARVHASVHACMHACSWDWAGTGLSRDKPGAPSGSGATDPNGSPAACRSQRSLGSPS